MNGLSIGLNRITVSHLQYADDTIILSAPTVASLGNTARILRSFQAFSGLHINFNKSGLLCVGVENSMSERLTNMLKCSTLKLPLQYLGFNEGLNE